MKSDISLISKAFASDNIGFKCLIFSNLFEGGAPTIFSIEFFKKACFFLT